MGFLRAAHSHGDRSITYSCSSCNNRCMGPCPPVICAFKVACSVLFRFCWGPSTIVSPVLLRMTQNDPVSQHGNHTCNTLPHRSEYNVELFITQQLVHRTIDACRLRVYACVLGTISILLASKHDSLAGFTKDNAK